MTSALRLLAAVFLVFSLQAAPAAGQGAVDRNCSDDRGIDRCSAEQQRRTRERFGVPSIEEHGAAGDQVRRAFYVDGYGRDLVAIVFVRPRGREPELRVHFFQDDEGAERWEPLVAPVPGPVWEDVIRRSEHFDRELVGLPPPPPESNVIILCIHSWVFTVEAVDPGGEDEQPTIRRRTEDGCQNGLAEAYADELERAAVPLIPHCARLDPELHRGHASLLAACGALSGDRLAAAVVMNRVSLFRHIREPEDASVISSLFEHDSVVDWNGERNEGPWSAAAFWASKVGVGDGGIPFFYSNVHGESADRVRATGMLSRLGAEDGHETALVEQIWTRDGSDFIIESISVGPFERSAAE